MLKWRHEISTAPDMAAAFADRARAESHCKSGGRGGDLGTFGRGKMQKAFEEASFALKVCGCVWVCVCMRDVKDKYTRVHLLSACVCVCVCVCGCGCVGCVWVRL